MVDIQSATAEIRRGIKKRRKKKPQDKNIMFACATQGGHNEVRDDGVAVASVASYANHLHLVADRQPRQHIIMPFLQARCSSCHPSNSVEALKANILRLLKITKSDNLSRCYTWQIF